MSNKSLVLGMLLVAATPVVAANTSAGGTSGNSNATGGTSGAGHASGAASFGGGHNSGLGGHGAAANAASVRTSALVGHNEAMNGKHPEEHAHPLVGSFNSKMPNKHHHPILRREPIYDYAYSMPVTACLQYINPYERLNDCIYPTKANERIR